MFPSPTAYPRPAKKYSTLRLHVSRSPLEWRRLRLMTSLVVMLFCNKRYGMVLYSAVSSPLDRSKRFTLSSPGRPVHSDTVLGFSWKHSRHAAIAQRLFTHISTTVSVYIARYSFIQLSRLRRREVKENAQTSKRYQRGFEPGLSRLRVRHSTTEPPRSTTSNGVVL